MTTEQLVKWVSDHKFDRETCRHSSNGIDTVLHCHHYASLYCQLADDAEEFNGKELLQRASEMSFWEVLSKYFEEHDVSDLDDRIALVEEYWKTSGFGTLKLDHVGDLSAAAHMDHSHVDEGWIKKWGQAGQAGQLHRTGIPQGGPGCHLQSARRQLYRLRNREHCRGRRTLHGSAWYAHKEK